jgi:hypothetical protein
VISALGAVMIESRAGRAGSLEAQARRASSIAGEALAACGRWVRAIDGAAAGDAVWVTDADAPRVLAVLAAAPALPLADSLPWQVRAVLRVLGIPMLAAPPAGAADAAAPVGSVTRGAGGVRVLVGDPSSPWAAGATSAQVALEATGYRVTFAPRA